MIRYKIQNTEHETNNGYDYSQALYHTHWTKERFNIFFIMVILFPKLEIRLINQAEHNNK